MMDEPRREASPARSTSQSGTGGKSAPNDVLPVEVTGEGRGTHAWRTREDPFADVSDELQALLADRPDAPATELLALLRQRHPGRFGDGQLRTLQRKLKAWREQAAPATGRWRIALLGGLRVMKADRPVARLPAQKVRLLLAYLAYHLGRSHPREELIHLLWPEAEPESGYHRLRQALFLLRRQFGPPGTPAGSGLIVDRSSVQLNSAVVTTDVAEFTASLEAAARAGSDEERWAALARAVDLYRGELLPGYYEEWVLQERAWLAERFFEALDGLLTYLGRAGDTRRALEYARRGVSIDPLREEAHAALMRLLAADGQPAAALRQYHELERLLKEQLGAAPAATTRALVREIERQSLLCPQLVVSPRAPGPRASVPSRAPGLTPTEGKHRLVTVLFAGIRRSAATTRDLRPEQAAALGNRLLSVMVDVLLKYEGRIDPGARPPERASEAGGVGDSLLAVFGILQAHEDDAERAIRAALEIRQAARKLGLEVTAGIDTGTVSMRAASPERQQEMTVVGPVVDLAARLQEQAQPGEILVGQATYRQTCRAVAFTSRSLATGTRAAGRGLAQPVAAYAVERALPRPEKARGIEGLRAELIGREEELAKLQAALAEVRHGQGQMVSLIGEAGIGKSRLVAELKATARGLTSPPCPPPRSGEGGARPAAQTSFSPPRFGEGPGERSTLLWLEGRSLEPGMTASYSLFVDLFQDIFRWPPEKGECSRRVPRVPAAPPVRAAGPKPWVRLVAALQECVARGALSAERADEMGPLLGNLLSLRFGNDWDLRLKNANPEHVRHQTLTALRDFFVALAQAQPVVLVLEDLHWADSLSLDAISLLMEALAQAPLLLLCLYRPEGEQKCWRLGQIASRKCPERYTELTLRELTPSQSCQMVASLLTIDSLPAALQALILERAHGNPFFLEEVSRALLDAGMLDPEAWRVREGVAPLRVSASVQSVIQSRADRLGPEVKPVLQTASVMGRLFPRRLLEQVLQTTGDEEGGLAPGELERALWELEERGLIYRERVVPEEEYSFRHVLTQEAIYESIPRRHRAVLHQQVAEAIEALYPEGLDEYSEQLAYHYERSAANAKAVEYLLKAGEKAGRAYLNEAAIDYFQGALERLDEPVDGSTPGVARKDWRLAALKGLGRIYHGIGRLSEAEEHLREAIALGYEMGLAPRELVRLYWRLADVLFWQDRLDETMRIGEEGLALLGDDTQSVEAALMNDRLAWCCREKRDVKRWEELKRRNAQLLEVLPYSEELRPAYVNLVDREYETGNIEEALKWLQALEWRGEQHDDLAALGQVRAWQGMIEAETGNLHHAVSRYQQSLELLAKTGDTKLETWSLLGLGEVFLQLGDLQKAARYLRQGLETAKIAASKWRVGHAYELMGTVARCGGSLKDAINALQKAADLFRELRMTGVGISIALGRVYLDRGERREALRELQEAAVRVRADPVLLAAAFASLEEVYGDPEEFRAFCRRFRDEYPEATATRFVQWFLEPAEVGVGCEAIPTFHDDFARAVSPDWVWQDPFGDCSFAVRNGLEIHAPNGRDLCKDGRPGFYRSNLSAPRLVRSAGTHAGGGSTPAVAGDFAVQTVCVPVSEGEPTLGGILLWKDQQSFLRLERGPTGRNEISFGGYLDGEQHQIGRGRLLAERLCLRLERLSRRVDALCSADGQQWFTVGQAEFPAGDAIQVGLYALGAIDRRVHPGAYPAGAAIRFESFQLWR